MKSKKEQFKITMVAQLENDVLHNCLYMEYANRGIEIISLENGIKATVYYHNSRIEKIVIQ